jgi:hypothetical protein
LKAATPMRIVLILAIILILQWSVIIGTNGSVDVLGLILLMFDGD